MLSTKRQAGDIAQPARALFATDRQLGVVSRRLALYLSHKITTPYKHEPLFVCCVREGLRRHARADAGECARAHYLHGALTKAAYVLRYNLVDQNGRWDPLYSEPLAYWLKGSSIEVTSESAPAWNLIPIDTFIAGCFHRLVEDDSIKFTDELKGYR